MWADVVGVCLWLRTRRMSYGGPSNRASPVWLRVNVLTHPDGAALYSTIPRRAQLECAKVTGASALLGHTTLIPFLTRSTATRQSNHLVIHLN